MRGPRELAAAAATGLRLQKWNEGRVLDGQPKHGNRGFVNRCRTLGVRNSESARALGILSPTPSADALFIVLDIAGCRDCFIASGDVSHAFMATPLRERDVVMKFPLSVSTVSGEPLYVHLKL